jgi:hypothetical protein
VCARDDERFAFEPSSERDVAAARSSDDFSRDVVAI